MSYRRPSSSLRSPSGRAQKRRNSIGLTLAICALFGAVAPASAQTSDAAYIAARNAAVAKIKTRDAANLNTTDAQMQQDTRTLHGLEAALRRIIGPVSVEGFSASGTANVETLSSGDVGFGALDALRFPSRDGQTNLFVTTDGLLADWLKMHRTWFEDEPPLPQKAEAALRRDAFYTQAISADAAVSLYAAVPVETRNDATLAVAELEATSQDLPPALPDALIVSVARARKLFVAVAPLTKAFAPVPACKATDAADAKKDPDSAAMLRCFAAHAGGQSAFAAARTQAQALVDQISK